MNRNAVLLGLDFGLFLVGLSFASPGTILPAFAAWLGAPNVVIGAIPAVMAAGWLMPSLFAAAHTQTLTHRLRFVLRYTAWERVPYLALAFLAFFVATRAPALTLVLLVAMLIVVAGTGGVLMPAWMDVIGRSVPTRLRGRFFAVSSTLGNVGGLCAGVVTAWIFARVAAPASYGFCFLGAAVFMGLSWLALAGVRESGPVGALEPEPLRAYLRRMPALVRADPNLGWYLASRVCAAAATIATAFYTVYGLVVLHAPAWKVGVFTTLLVAGQLVGLAVLGWLADHAGHRLVLTIGVAALLAANLLALGARSLDALSVVFVLAGVHQAAINVSSLNILLEFAPSPAERPTYVGLGGTLIGPVVFVGPLIAGLLADVVGFAATFALAAAFGAASVLLLVARVRDPREEEKKRLRNGGPSRMIAR